MKKITSLLMLFLVLLGTSSVTAAVSYEDVMPSDLNVGDRIRVMVQPVEGNQGLEPRYLCYNNSGVYTDKNAGDAKAIWTLKASSATGQFYLYNETAQHFAGKTPNNGQVPMVAEAEAGSYLFEQVPNSTLMVIKCCNATGITSNADKIYLTFQTNSCIVVRWGAAGAHSQWTVQRQIEKEVTPDPTPAGDYPLVAGITANTDYTHGSRRLNGVALQSQDGSQRVGFSAPLKVYTPCLDKVFKAKVGETVTATFDYTKDWMNGYIYIDRDNDGHFGQKLGGEVMAYSHLGGKDSNGKEVDGIKVNPPSFTLPAELTPGIYRMRYKVDWDCIDPAGRGEGSNKTMDNGGAFCDILINVHGDQCKMTAVVADHGTLEVPAAAAFGQDLTVKVHPASGFVCQKVVVRHGYRLDGEPYVHGNRQYVEDILPGYLVREGQLVVPAEMMDGEVKLTPVFSAAIAPEGEAYAVFDKNAVRNNAGRTLKGLSFESLHGGKTGVTLPADGNQVYQDLTAQEIAVKAGDRVKMTADFVGSGLHYYLFVDWNEDGQFTADLSENGKPAVSSELVAYTYLNGKNSNGETIADKNTVSMAKLPDFYVSERLSNGNYRARLVVADNDMTAAGSAALVDLGGYVVDFLMNVNDGHCPLTLHTLNGNVYGPDNTALPMTVQPFQGNLTVVPTPVAEGYTAKEMKIKVGYRLEGPAEVNGNRQWTEYTVPAQSYTLTKDKMRGEVSVTVNFEKGADASYDLVFFDEFNGENGSQPDAEKWQRSIRYNATWNRWVSKSNDVVFLRDGNLVTRAIKNPQITAEDPGDMITGAIESRERFTWKWGKVECRAKANLHIGTFPAIWMMPENQGKGWPNDGEIDIFEAVNNDHKAFHTIHTTYSYAQKNNGIGSNEYQNLDLYHTYGLEWSPTQLKFFVDGKLVWTYNKSTDAKALEGGQWPFDNNFYLILNQSVGNSDGRGWAKAPDLNYTYEFLVDWIRVYQTPANRAKCELQTAIFEETRGREEGVGVNSYTYNHQVLDEAKRLYATSTDVQALTAATQQVKEGVASLNMPTPNNFYRIRCAEQTGQGNDMKYLQSTQTEGKQNLVSGEAGKGVEATFLYTADGLISYTRGLYCGAESLLSAGQKAQAIFSEAKNGKRGQYNIQLGDQFIYGSEAVMQGGQPDHRNGFNWWLEPVNELQVSFGADAQHEGAYATLYTPVALQMPADVTAFKGVQKNGMVKLTAIEGNIIPAGQAVVLKTAEAGVKILTVTTETGAANMTGNEFKGSAATTVCGENAFYAMGKKNNLIAFYTVTGGQYRGFRAVLEKSGAMTNELKMVFDEATGIEGVETENPVDAVYYDLSGRRVKTPGKGLYLVNGKKMYLK